MIFIGAPEYAQVIGVQVNLQPGERQTLPLLFAYLVA
jgi:hypothetical protein